MQKRDRKRVPVKADINVTPFNDILLVLLVIFMTITPKEQHGFRTNLPQQPPPDSARETVRNDRTIVVSLDRDGIVRVNQTEVDEALLASELQAIFKTRNDKTAFVQADPELLFDQVAHLIDSVRSGGVDRLGLMTEQIAAR